MEHKQQTEETFDWSLFIKHLVIGVIWTVVCLL